MIGWVVEIIKYVKTQSNFIRYLFTNLITYLLFSNKELKKINNGKILIISSYSISSIFIFSLSNHLIKSMNQSKLISYHYIKL